MGARAQGLFQVRMTNKDLKASVSIRSPSSSYELSLLWHRMTGVSSVCGGHGERVGSTLGPVRGQERTQSWRRGQVRGKVGGGESEQVVIMELLAPTTCRNLRRAGLPIPSGSKM